jgi:hypothetical protein
MVVPPEHVIRHDIKRYRIMRLSRNAEFAFVVILNEVKNLIITPC